MRSEMVLKHLLSKTESPIERALLKELADYFEFEQSRFLVIARSPFEWDRRDNVYWSSGIEPYAAPFAGLQRLGVAISAQVITDRYRADFAIQKIYVEEETVSIGRTVLIECDGHQHHNAHAWQIERDETRDMIIMGRFPCSILRLRGFEIHQNAYACAGRALDLLDHLAWQPSSEDRRVIGLRREDLADSGEHND